MTSEELKEKLKLIQRQKCESRTLELKAAAHGCPRHLYDTLSSFSNQDEGGVIIFGVDEEAGFKETGVYDPQDLQNRIGEQCLQMEPVVRPLLTVLEEDGRCFVSAEIPGLDLAERPCYYKGRGVVKGSYVRVGDRDEPMTEYEVYSFEAFRKRYRDDIRPAARASMDTMDGNRLARYLLDVKEGKPNLSALDDGTVSELMGITAGGCITLAGELLFGIYPQAYFPQLCITAVVVPGTEMGELGEGGERFLDNERIEGTIPDMLDGAVRFVNRNMRRKTIINPYTGMREDRTDYPVAAVREALLNALVHRDYSIHTEGMPVQLLIYQDRLEIKSPGGVYGRIRPEQLGKVQPDTRNPVLASALEVLGVTENRYSGIPTMQREMKRFGLPPAELIDEKGGFTVILRRNCRNAKGETHERHGTYGNPPGTEGVVRETGTYGVQQGDLTEFCRIPRTRQEICGYLGLSSVTYAMNTYIRPLIEEGKIRMTIPDKPKSPKQRFYSA